MKFIKLSQRGTVERQGKYGWEPETVYEPVFVAAGHIVIVSSPGYHLSAPSLRNIMIVRSPLVARRTVEPGSRLLSSKAS